MILRRTMSVVGTVAALAVGHLVTSHLDVNERDADPFIRSGHVGEVVHLDYADVRVTDVRPAAYMAGLTSTDLARVAAGVFVLVTVDVTATRETTTMATAFLVDREGRQMELSVRADCAGSVTTKTAVPVYALYCFDVPVGSLSGLRFRTGRGSPIFDSTRGDGVAEVDLDISEADAEAWADTRDVYEPVASSDQPFELQSVDLEEGGS